MPDPDVLERAEKRLREDAGVTQIIYETDDLSEAADLLLAIRTDEAQVVYPCRTHVTPMECERANFESMLQAAEHRGLLQNGTHSAVSKFLTEYMSDGHHQDCHS